MANRLVGLDVGQELVGVDDFDGDLRNDLVFRDSNTGAVAFWLLGGPDGVEVQGAPVPLTGAAPPPLDWHLEATGDFNHDGQPDLVWRNIYTRRIAVWLIEGMAWRGMLLPNPDQAADPNWEIVAALDFNGDGERDLLWYNATSGRVVQWLLDGHLQRVAGRFTDPPQAGDANWRVVAAGDYGTGLGGPAGTNDIVWRNALSGRLVVWFLDATGRRTSGTYTTPAAPTDALAWSVVGPR